LIQQTPKKEALDSSSALIRQAVCQAFEEVSQASLDSNTQLKHLLAYSELIKWLQLSVDELITGSV